MSQHPHLSRESRIHLVVCGALALGTLLLYAPTFQYPFVNYDDPLYVYENQYVQGGLTPEGLRWVFTTFEGGNWHPLTWLSFQLDTAIYGGLNAGGFHFTNVLLHTVNTLLLFLVLSQMTGAVWRSAVVAALFALHPLHVESVAWVSERKDVLSTLFWMLSLAAYLAYVRRPGLGHYLLVALALTLGLLAKAMLVTLPCVLLLLDWWPLGRWRAAASRNRVLLEKLPLFALILTACVVTFIAQSQESAVAGFEMFPLAARIANALLAYVAYLRDMLWPLSLAVHYPHAGRNLSVGPALAAGVLLAAVTVLVLVPGRRWPYLAVGWFWYLGTLVPVIGLVQVGGQAMADRYTYVPLIGIFLALTWGVSDLASAWQVPRWGLVAATAFLLTACAALTWIQVGYWKSDLDLWEHAVAVTRNNPRALQNLGSAYHKAGRSADAERELRKAVAMSPGQSQAHVSLAALLTKMGRYAEAIAPLQYVIALEPGNALHHNDLGHVLQKLGRFGEARAEYQQAIALDGTYALPHHNLAVVLLEEGQNDEALAQLRAAIALDPGNAQFHKDLGKVLQALGRLEDALTAFQKAVDLGDKEATSLLQAGERLRTERPTAPRSERRTRAGAPLVCVPRPDGPSGRGT
jgi:Flp pilus assembly protein TadD